MCHGFSLVDSLSSYPSPDLTFAPLGSWRTPSRLLGQLEDFVGAGGGMRGFVHWRGAVGCSWDLGDSAGHTFTCIFTYIYIYTLKFCVHDLAHIMCSWLGSPPLSCFYQVCEECAGPSPVAASSPAHSSNSPGSSSMQFHREDFMVECRPLFLAF